MRTTTIRLKDALNAYVDNAKYEEEASPAKCRAFITACRQLKALRPISGGGDGESLSFEPGQLKEESAMARAWLAVNGSSSGAAGGSSRYIDLSCTRD